MRPRTGWWRSPPACGWPRRRPIWRWPRSTPSATADESVIADIGIERPERLAETGARLQRARTGPGRSRSQLDRVAAGGAVRDSRQPHGFRPIGAGDPLAARRRDRRRRLCAGPDVLRDRPAPTVRAPPHARAGTAGRGNGYSARPLERVSRAGASAPSAWWLESRMRFAIRVRAARYSLTSALGRGLQIGLPMAAIIVASVPIWGMSWYFDTENWAAGIWNSWAAQRTDTWREAMVRAVVAGGQTTLDGRGFMVRPEGLNGSAPFSFIVIGDTGEGDASQHVLRDSLIRAASADDVRFVVLSSDVVYPTGAMRDYELKFWLPFKGVTKPVYAIPGNHDWYDALEGFVATFFQPDAARVAMRARIEADEGVSSTTDAGIEALIKQGRLPARPVRRAHGIPAGAVLPGADAGVRAAGGGHRRAASRGPRGADLASRGARSVAREDGDGRARTSALRRRPRRRRRATKTSWWCAVCCANTACTSSWRGTRTTSSTTSKLSKARPARRPCTTS